MSELELINYIRARLANGEADTFIDAKGWLDDMEQRFPHIPREVIQTHLRSEARKAGINGA